MFVFFFMITKHSLFTKMDIHHRQEEWADTCVHSLWHWVDWGCYEFAHFWLCAHKMCTHDQLKSLLSVVPIKGQHHWHFSFFVFLLSLKCTTFYCDFCEVAPEWYQANLLRFQFELECFSSSFTGKKGVYKGFPRFSSVWMKRKVMHNRSFDQPKLAHACRTWETIHALMKHGVWCQAYPCIKLLSPATPLKSVTKLYIHWVFLLLLLFFACSCVNFHCNSSSLCKWSQSLIMLEGSFINSDESSCLSKSYNSFLMNKFSLYTWLPRYCQICKHKLTRKLPIVQNKPTCVVFK